MNRRSFFASLLAPVVMAVAEKVVPAALAKPRPWQIGDPVHGLVHPHDWDSFPPYDWDSIIVRELQEDGSWKDLPPVPPHAPRVYAFGKLIR